MIAMNTRNSVSDVASLMRLSPEMTVMMRRGRPRRRPMDAADTASGGATIAPSSSAPGRVSEGMMRNATAPTASAVISTSQMPRRRICGRLCRKLTNETSSAAE